MSIKAAEIFEKMEPILKEKGPEIVKKVGAIFAFEIKPSEEAKPVIYTVDLKNGNGKSTVCLIGNV